MYSMMIEHGLISKEKAMEKLGNANVQAELEKMLKGRKQEIESSVVTPDFVKDYQSDE